MGSTCTYLYNIKRCIQTINPHWSVLQLQHWPIYELGTIDL